MSAHEQSEWLGIDWGAWKLPTLYSTYMWVWAALLILTVVEVIIPDPHMLNTWGLVSPAQADWLAGYMPRIFVVVSLILLALAKTFCVAWYYMHLIDERPSIILIACAPFLFSIFLTIGLWPHEAPNSRIKGEPGKNIDLGAQSQLESAPAPSEPEASISQAEGMQLAEQALSERQ